MKPRQWAGVAYPTLLAVAASGVDFHPATERWLCDRNATSRMILMRTYPLSTFVAVNSPLCGRRPDGAAVFSIPVGDTTVYLKREVWGLNGNRVVLSTNPGWQQMPLEGDYEWGTTHTPTFLFRVEGRALHVWAYGSQSWRAPSKPFPVAVVFHDIDINTHREMSEHPARHGVSRIGYDDWRLQEPPADPVPVGTFRKSR